MPTILTTFKLRRDTAANWTSVNPTLAAGEPGLETDTLKVKYGDGATAWNSLGYAATEPANGDKGDITVAAGVWTIDANAVTDAKFRQSGALSVVGRSANSTGNVADIAAGSDHQVLRRSGTTLAFGTVATDGLADGAVTFAKMQDITTARVLGRTTASTGDIEELTISGTGSVAMTASPTFTGTVGGAAGNFTGNFVVGGTLAAYAAAPQIALYNAGLGARLAFFAHTGANLQIGADTGSVQFVVSSTVRLQVNTTGIVVNGVVSVGTFTVGTMPASIDGSIAFATDGRKIGEGAAAGTGVLAYRDGGNWYRASDDSVLAA